MLGLCDGVLDGIGEELGFRDGSELGRAEFVGSGEGMDEGL